MAEGVSAKVEFEKCGRIAVKQFKAESLGYHPMLDYQNEVAVLTVLDHYREDLSFQVPKLTEYGVYNNRESDESAVAYIKMSKLENADVAAADDVPVARDAWKDQIKYAARALANLHSLNILPEDQAILSRNPMELQEQWLREKPASADNSHIIDKLASKMSQMDGDLVLIHNDFGSHNVCMKSVGDEVTGVYDFCFSGMGVRELDFRGFLGVPALEKIFIGEYEEASGVTVNRDNLDVVRAYRAVSSKLATDKECDDALKTLDKVDLGYDQGQPLPHQMPLALGSI